MGFHNAGRFFNLYVNKGVSIQEFSGRAKEKVR